jgi:hypothetical protein
MKALPLLASVVDRLRLRVHRLGIVLRTRMVAWALRQDDQQDDDDGGDHRGSQRAA